jgi:hypothetical protein
LAVKYRVGYKSLVVFIGGVATGGNKNQQPEHSFFGEHILGLIKYNNKIALLKK